MDSQLTIRRVPIEALALDPANARTHDETNLAAIEGSLRRFGQAEPLVVQASTKRVAGGNGRLAVMRQLGWTERDVVELDVDDLQATALGGLQTRQHSLDRVPGEVLPVPGCRRPNLDVGPVGSAIVVAPEAAGRVARPS